MASFLLVVVCASATVTAAAVVVAARTLRAGVHLIYSIAKRIHQDAGVRSSMC